MKLDKKKKMVNFLTKNTDMRRPFLEALKDSDLEGLYKIIKKNLQ